MTHDEWLVVWNKLTGLWPQWNASKGATRIEADAWQRTFGNCRYAPMLEAVEEHWRSGDAKFAPNPKAVLKLLNQLSRDRYTPEEWDAKRRFEAMTPLEKARALRDYHASEAKNANLSDHERERHENIADTAAKQVKRLHAVEQWRATQPPAEPISELELMALCGHARTKR